MCSEASPNGKANLWGGGGRGWGVGKKGVVGEGNVGRSTLEKWRVSPASNEGSFGAGNYTQEREGGKTALKKGGGVEHFTRRVLNLAKR